MAFLRGRVPGVHGPRSAASLLLLLAGTVACGGKAGGPAPPTDAGPTCGNGRVEPGETCDGSDLRGETCASRGYLGGTLACDETCTGFRLTGCHRCGDGVKDSGEACDGADLDGLTCRTLGHLGGALACTADCLHYDTSGCVVCGDGRTEAPETCDGMDLPAGDCGALGFDGGELACDDDCSGYSGCTTCGDGVCELARHETASTCAADCAWSAVAAGRAHTCAVANDGRLWCWGQDGWAQLGDGGFDDQLLPLPVPIYLPAVSLGLGMYHSCLVADDGRALCWGCNAWAQLGLTGDEYYPDPQVVTGPVGVAQVSAGGGHTCARTLAGEVWCWGVNSNGQVGTGAPLSGFGGQPPALVPDATDVVDLSTAYMHACAAWRSGEVRCWGWNGYGQLGDGGVEDRDVPVTVLDLADASAIGVGYAHSCAVTGTGEVRCWGLNTSGQLGDGTRVDRRTPVAVAGLDGVTVVAPGEAHTCALRLDGTVWCWGYNVRGELGDGSGDLARETPAPVAGLAGIVEIASGWHHTCARGGDGALWCWGLNDSGRLGDGTELPRATPVPVGGE